MSKYHELLKQEIRNRRLPLEAHFPRNHETSLLMLTYNLEWDYEILRNQIAWRILFLKRKLERIKSKSLPQDVSSVNEKRLSNSLSKARKILDIIDQRLKYVDYLRSMESNNLSASIRKKEVASKVRDLFEDE